ncbi:unnamed protein product [Polarella glacialis]|uniref:Aquaporin n=1 Tax=Polarella glacialis TaxID=89957 RepID=A0A813HDD0_POLGL|nr:unnamed protein product [Polarella glacialis]
MASFTLAAILAEFVGTFMLVFSVGCNALSKSPPAWAPTSIACTLMVMVYALASVSGAHLNPAVTLASGLARKCAPSKAFAYIVTQLLAGFAASCAYSALYQASAPSVGPQAGFSWWQAATVEIVYTAMLAFVVLNVTSKRNNSPEEPNQFYGLAIGFVVVAGGYGGGRISGAAFNPAIALSLGASTTSQVWPPTWIYQSLAYTLYEVLGAVLAATLFRMVRPEDFASSAEFEHYEPALVTRLLSEFLGTFMLVLTVGLNVLCNSPATAWSAAASLMAMIYALGDVSGGHFNPAVTLAVTLSRKSNISFRDLICYWVIQASAGVLAALLYSSLGPAGATFGLGPKAPYSDRAAYILEFTFTLVLAFVVLSVACVKGISTQLSRNHYYGLAIGACVTAGGVAAGKVSGGLLNPALSLGIRVSHALNGSGPDMKDYVTNYCLTQLLAGLAAWLLFLSTHAKEYAGPKTDRRLFSQA